MIQADCDNLADILWWLAGYMANKHEDDSSLVKLGDDHLMTIIKIRQEWNRKQKESGLPE